jgi:hypothetical protein
MVINHSAHSLSSQSIQETHRKEHKKVAVLAAIGGVALSAAYGSRYLDKEPIHTSKLTGEEWLEELMEGDLLCIVNATRYSK